MFAREVFLLIHTNVNIVVLLIIVEGMNDIFKSFECLYKAIREISDNIVAIFKLERHWSWVIYYYFFHYSNNHIIQKMPNMGNSGKK